MANGRPPDPEVLGQSLIFPLFDPAQMRQLRQVDLFFLPQSRYNHFRGERLRFAKIRTASTILFRKLLKLFLFDSASLPSGCDLGVIFKNTHPVFESGVRFSRFKSAAVFSAVWL